MKLSSIFFAVILILTVATPANAENPHYCEGAKNLPLGTILSKSALKRIDVASYSQMPARAISGDTVLYGCKLYSPLKKGEAVTTGHVCSIATKDKTKWPKWVQYIRLGIANKKSGNYDFATRYTYGALTELEALAKKRQRITDYAESCFLTDLNFLPSEINTAQSSSNRLSSEGSVDERQRALVQKIQNDLKTIKAQLNFHVKLNTALKQLMDSENMHVSSAAEQIKIDQDSYASSLDLLKSASR